MTFTMQRNFLSTKNALRKTSPKPSSTEKLLNRKEAASYLNVSPGTLAVWDCTKRYDLKPIKLGGRSVRYRKSELDRFLENQLRQK